MKGIPAPLKQPIIYFALAGGAVFGVDSALRSGAESIQVTDTVRKEVAAQLEQSLLRPPTAEELQQGIGDWVNTELLYREAEALGLQHNDSVIRAHLARKLELLVRDRSVVDQPTEAEIEAELANSGDRFSGPETFDVTHAFVLQPKNKPPEPARIDGVLTLLRAGADPLTAGDHFPRGPKFTRIPRARLEQIVGAPLSDLLRRDKLNQWQTVTGSRGIHFIRLDAVHGGEATVESARQGLIGEIVEKRKGEAARQFVADLREKYTVEGL